MSRSLIAKGLCWFMAASSAEASFLRDVVSPKGKNRVQDALLAKAVPLEEYRAALRSRGMDFGTDSRELQNNNGMDDYYMDESFMNDFTGYSLKFASCQPVQRFSEDAVLAGEYNPLVTDDIVVLRLCPSSSCNPKRAFGCSSKYIDYAISIGDYVRIMLRYKMDKKQNLCNWCSSCLEQQRRLEDQVVEDEVQNDDTNQDDQVDQEMNEDQDQAEVEQNDDAQNNEEAAAGDDAVAGDDAAGATGDDNAANGDDGASDVQSSSACPYFETYCYANGVSVCDDETANGDDGQSGYMAIEGYFNLLNCQNVNGYYLRPRCNGYDQSISMGIFYDKFCSQYAGDKVNVNSLFGGLGIEPNIFQDFSSGKSCVDCSESSSGPFYDSNSNMCNRLHTTASTCTTNLQNVFNDSSYEDEAQCTYIEMLRKGAYDEEGRIYTARSIIRQVTSGQKVGLAASILLCALLAVYSCYLHHLITNILVRSISHNELLPPSRASRRRGSKGSSKSKRGASSSIMGNEDDDDDDDWQEVSKVARKNKSSSSGRHRSDRSRH